MRRRSRARLWALLLSGLLLAACRTTPPPTQATVVVSPATATLAPGDTQLFTATVTGTADTTVAWSATGGSLVGAAGSALFTAPMAPGEYLVTASSVADPGRSASAVVTVSMPAGSTVVRLPLTPVPGSNPADLRVVSGLGEGPVDLASGAGDFSVFDDVVGTVGLIDVAREFGWTAVWPAWFAAASPAAGPASDASPTAADTIGPLSTAVWLVFIQPSVYHTDLLAAGRIVATLRSLPALHELAGFLEANAPLGDPLDAPGFAPALTRAIEAALDALDVLAATDAGAETPDGPSADPRAAGAAHPASVETSIRRIDHQYTRFELHGTHLRPAWEVGSHQRGMTWIGMVYEVDAGAYAGRSALESDWLFDPWRTDIALRSPAPVGSLYLGADTFWQYFDLVALAIDVAFDLLTEAVLPPTLDLSERAGAYTAHLYTCSLASYWHPENFRNDLGLIENWPSDRTREAAEIACVVNVAEFALDAVSVFIPLGSDDEVSRTVVSEAVEEFVTSSTMSVFQDIVAATAPSESMAEAIGRMTLIYASRYGEAFAKAGLKAKIKMGFKSLLNGLDLLGRISSAGKLGARIGNAFALTPWEGSAVFVGDAWARVEVEIAPDAIVGLPGEYHVFTATVTGTADTRVSWSATCGDVSRIDARRASLTLPDATGTCLVTATSVADPTRSATARVGIETPLWARQFGTAVDDRASDVAVDGAGDIYVVGHTLGNLGGGSHGGADAYVSKFDRHGTQRWTRQFGTGGEDWAFGVAVDDEGDVWVTGWTGGSLDGASAGSSDAFVRKYDADGVLLWGRQFGTEASDYAYAIAVDRLGQAVVTGTTSGSLDGSTAGPGDGFVRKLDGDGNTVWTRQIGTTGWNEFLGVAIADDGRIAVVGNTRGALAAPNAGNADAFVLVLDADGATLWARQFGTAYYDTAHGVAFDAPGNLVVAGYLSGADIFDIAGFVHWYDDAGGLVGEATVWAALEGLAIGSGGETYVTGYNPGYAGSWGSVGARPVLAKLRMVPGFGVYDLWSLQFGTDADDYAHAVAVDGAGSAIVVGRTRGDLAATNAGGFDAFLWKHGVADDAEERPQELRVCDVWSAVQSGGAGVTIDTWDVSTIPLGATFDVRFDAFSIPDRFVFEYPAGHVALDTGWRGNASYEGDPDFPGGIAGPGQGQLDDIFARGTQPHFRVTVSGPKAGTAWNYQVRCRE